MIAIPVYWTIFLIVPIMYPVLKVRKYLKPRIKAWLMSRGLTKAVNDPLLGLYAMIFTNAMVISGFIFLQLATFLGWIPSIVPDWVQLYALAFGVMAIGALFPIINQAYEGKGFFKAKQVEEAKA